MPVLDRSRTALKGCVVHLQWSIPNGLLNIGPEPFVRAHVAAALHVLGDQGPDDRVVVVGKSVGGYAAALAAERGLPAIWLTPLLHDHELVDAIASSPAPALLVGGTADKHWHAPAAAATEKQVLTVLGADHNLHVPGSVRENVEALARIGDAIETFLAEQAATGTR